MWNELGNENETKKEQEWNEMKWMDSDKKMNNQMLWNKHESEVNMILERKWKQNRNEVEMKAKTRVKWKCKTKENIDIKMKWNENEMKMKWEKNEKDNESKSWRKTKRKW